jgi:hypothetical protein
MKEQEHNQNSQHDSYSNSNKELHFTHYFAKNQVSIHVMDETLNAKIEPIEKKTSTSDVVDIYAPVNNSKPVQDEGNTDTGSTHKKEVFAMLEEKIRTLDKKMKIKESDIHTWSMILGVFTGLLVSAFTLHLASIEPLTICRLLFWIVSSFIWIPTTLIFSHLSSKFFKFLSPDWMTMKYSKKIYQRIIDLWDTVTITEQEAKELIEDKWLDAR